MRSRGVFGTVVGDTGVVTRALAAMVLDDVDEPELGRRICRACVDGLDVDGAAISLLTGTTSRVTLAISDDVAGTLEDLQFSLNEGACMEAAATGRPVLAPDLTDAVQTARWPLFAREVVARTGVAAVFALPLQWGATNLGVLDLYRRAPGRLTDEQWHDAAAAADTAAALILGRRTDPAGRGPPASAGTEPDWVSQVSGHRVEIYQATGMVQVQLEVSGTEALARMRGHAFVHQRQLIDVARDVVERRLVFTEDME